MSSIESSVTQPHSGLGIASFVLSIVSLISAIAVFSYAGYVEITSEGGMDENSTTALVVGIAIIVCVVMFLVGLVLGVVGLLRQDRRRIFAAIGIGMNGLFTALVGVLIWYGNTYG